MKFRKSPERVKNALRHLLIPLWNSYSFFVTYARIDGWSPKSNVRSPRSANLLDRLEDYDLCVLAFLVRDDITFLPSGTGYTITRSGVFDCMAAWIRPVFGAFSSPL